MNATDATLLTAILIVVILIVAWFAHRAQDKESYCAGPTNINKYDHPYTYPTYEGRGATWWDGDRHCASYCQQSPCVVWCR
jgi:hypothetical protein